MWPRLPCDGSSSLQTAAVLMVEEQNLWGFHFLEWHWHKNQRKIIQCLLRRISGMYVTNSSTDTCQIQQRLPTHSIDAIEKTGRALTNAFWTGSMQKEKKGCRKDSESRRACWHSARLGCSSVGLSEQKDEHSERDCKLTLSLALALFAVWENHFLELWKFFICIAAAKRSQYLKLAELMSGSLLRDEPGCKFHNKVYLTSNHCQTWRGRFFRPLRQKSNNLLFQHTCI